MVVIGEFLPLIFFYSKVMRHIKLSETEKKELARLYETTTNAVIKRRCKALLMSNMEVYSMQEIVDEIGICRTTLYHLFNRWEFSTNRKDRPNIRCTDKREAASDSTCVSVSYKCTEVKSMHRTTIRSGVRCVFFCR